MTDMIPAVLLSDPMIFIMVALGVITVTMAAISRREFTSYILGWLLGIFLVLLFSTFLSKAESESDSLAEGLSFVLVFFPGLIGISLGIGISVLFAVTQRASDKRVRSIGIAVAMSSLISGGYVLLLSAQSIRIALGVFAMGIVIGVLSHRVFTRRSVSSSRTRGLGEPYDVQAEREDDLGELSATESPREYGSLRERRLRRGRPPTL